MAKERFSLTCAPGGENHAGMEIIGRMPVKGEGFTATDLEGLSPYFMDLGHNSSVLNLNELGDVNKIKEFSIDDQARENVLGAEQLSASSLQLSQIAHDMEKRLQTYKV